MSDLEGLNLEHTDHPGETTGSAILGKTNLDHPSEYLSKSGISAMSGETSSEQPTVSEATIVKAPEVTPEQPQEKFIEKPQNNVAISTSPTLETAKTNIV